jgi:Cytochrome c554 and c-prime
MTEARIRLAGLIVALATGLAGPVLFSPNVVKAEGEVDAKKEARHEYNEKVAATYNYRYGKEFPFLPSNATTNSGEFMDPKMFLTAAYCGHCHQESHKQWRESAHSNANRVPYYLKNVALLNDSKGIEFSRHCEGCHDPIALVSGALTEAGPKKRPYDQDGVTCTVCHSIEKVDTRGTTEKFFLILIAIAKP